MKGEEEGTGLPIEGHRAADPLPDPPECVPEEEQNHDDADDNPNGDKLAHPMVQPRFEFPERHRQYLLMK
jgi:hypothetical protein